MYLANKEIVKERFQKNYATYNKQAVVQKQIASKLVQLMVKKNLFHFNKIVEIGCGTGFLTEKIIKTFKVREYIINDLTSSYYESIKLLGNKNNFNNFFYVPGDAEIIDFPDKLDAIISTSTFQWFHNLNYFFKKVNRLLNDRGLFSFSTFGKENFKEIRATLNVGLNYKSLKEHLRLIEPNFEIVSTKEWTQKEVFPNSKEVLRHVKYTGVNGVCQCYFGKEKLVKFENDYSKQFSNPDQTVNLTYHPIIIIARKKKL